MKPLCICLLPVACAILVLTPFSPIGCGGSSSSVPVTGDLVVLAEGTNLHLLSVTAGGVSLVGSASLPPAGLLGGHTIWNVIKHPTQPWLYTCSGNECRGNGMWCWGDARIDRWVYSALGIAHLGVAFVYDAGAGPACGAQPGYEGVEVGRCSPVGMAFSSDATRLYVDEDDDDIFHILSVDAAGALAFVGDGASTSYHGMATYPGGPYLYNGSRTYDVTGDVAVQTAAGTRGNATEVFDLGGGTRGLITTLNNDDLAIYDLTVPATPALIDQFDVTEGGTYGQATHANSGPARYQAHTAGASRIVVVGVEYVATMSFDGAVLAVEDRIVDADPLDVINRGVALALNGTRALVAWHKPWDALGNPLDPFQGGMTVYSIAPDGSLAALTTVNFPSQARALLNVP